MANLETWGVDHASPLPAMDNAALKVLVPARLSPYVIEELRFTLPANLFISIDMDVDLCQTVAYLCEDTTDVPRFNDGALDGPTKNVTLSPPRIKEFHGFHKGSFQTKLAKEQVECMQRSPILMAWYRKSLMRAVEDGKQAIMARFYMYAMTNGVHPKNTGNNAGLVESGYVLGTPEEPIILNPNDETGVDDFYDSLLEVADQMPMAGQHENDYPMSQDNLFLFGPTKLKQTARQYRRWHDYDKIGPCGACYMMDSGFDRMPYGIMHITSRCVHSRVCKTGNQTLKSYPILFGRRYQGIKAAIRVDTRTWESQDGESIFFRTNFYFHIHAYDCRNMGIAWVAFENRKPRTIACGA